MHELSFKTETPRNNDICNFEILCENKGTIKGHAQVNQMVLAIELLISSGPRGGARPYQFRQAEARRAEKLFLETGHPPYLRVPRSPPPPLI